MNAINYPKNKDFTKAKTKITTEIKNHNEIKYKENENFKN